MPNATADFYLDGSHVVMLLLSTVMAGATVLFHYEVMSWASRLLAHLRLAGRRRILVLIAIILLAHVVEIWFFAVAYWQLQAWPSMGSLSGSFQEGAIDFAYFSSTVFTTLGFGDIVPNGPLRILVSTESVVGLGVLTWSATLTFLQMQQDWSNP